MLIVKKHKKFSHIPNTLHSTHLYSISIIKEKKVKSYFPT